MALLVGVGGRNSNAFEPVVTFMEASSRDAVVLFVNLGSRYHVCFWRAGPRYILRASRATRCPKVATTRI